MNLVNVDFPETSFLSCLFIYRGEVGEGGGGGDSTIWIFFNEGDVLENVNQIAVQCKFSMKAMIFHFL